MNLYASKLAKHFTPYFKTCSVAVKQCSGFNLVGGFGQSGSRR
jgi:hypothetical protein